MKPYLPLLTASALLLLPALLQAQVGRRFPAEKRDLVDSTTGFKMVAITSDPANDAKPYQTHTTWTSDGEWVIFRGERGGSGPQAFLVHEKTGDIIQLTEGSATGTGSLNLSRKAMKLYFMRGGPVRNPGGVPQPGPALPRQLVELDLGRLVPDAMNGKPKPARDYERVVATLPEDLRDSGGFALDADETVAYWGVTWGPPPAPPAPPAAPGASGASAAKAPAGDNRKDIDSRNTDPREEREAARKRFAERGRGPGGIRKIDLKTGAVSTVIDLEIRMGHVQANPWVAGEIIYCHETTGDAPQRMWTVRGDGSGNRPLYVEGPDEWVTHETVSGKDEIMFNIMGHLPYLRHKPTGVAVINLRNDQMTIIGQMEEKMENGGTGGFWHCNGSPDGRWAVADNFAGTVTLIDRKTLEQIPLTTGHFMRPDHAHPIFSPDSRRVLIQSGKLTEGKSLDLISIPIPEHLLNR